MQCISKIKNTLYCEKCKLSIYKISCSFSLSSWICCIVLIPKGYSVCHCSKLTLISHLCIQPGLSSRSCSGLTESLKRTRSYYHSDIVRETSPGDASQPGLNRGVAWQTGHSGVERLHVTFILYARTGRRHALYRNFRNDARKWDRYHGERKNWTVDVTMMMTLTAASEIS